MDIEVKNFYDNDAKNYENSRFTTSIGRYNNNVHKEIVMNVTDSWAGKKVMDLCCGTGRFSMEIAKHGGIVVSLDFSREMLREIADKSRKTSIKNNVHLIQADAQNLMFKDNTFDGCVCVTAINLIKDYDEVIKEIARVLKPNGFLIMDFRYLQGLYFPLGVYVNATHRAIEKKVYSRWFSLNEIKTSFRDAGLKIQKIQGNFYIPQNTPTPFDYFLKKIDKYSRDTILKYLSASLFVRAVKIEESV